MPFNLSLENHSTLKIQVKEPLNKSDFEILPFVKKDTLSFLKQTMRLGGLFFNGKELIPDLFSTAQVMGKIKDDKLYGFFLFKGEEIPFESCSAIFCGPPPFFIKGSGLKLIDIDKNSLQRLIKGDLTLLDEDLDFEIKGALKEKIPTPELYLKDPTGAFADFNVDQKYYSYFEKDLLETDYIKKQVGTSHYYCPVDKVSKTIQFLLEIGWSIFDWKRQRVILCSSENFSCGMDEKGIFIKGSLKFDSYEPKMADIIGAYNRKDKFLQLGEAVALLPQNHKILDLCEDVEIVTDRISFKKKSDWFV